MANSGIGGFNFPHSPYTMKLDQWQQDVLAERSSNLLLCSGRQTGKSLVASIAACRDALATEKFSVLIVSSTERQSEELLSKCLRYLEMNAPRKIVGGKDRPTKHIINLVNGSVIRCLPVAASASGIRGFTVNLLIVDE